MDGKEPENNPADYEGNAESAGIEVVSRILSHATSNNFWKNRSTPYDKQILLGDDVEFGSGEYNTDTDFRSALRFNMFVNNEYTMMIDESNASDFKDYEAFVVYTLVSNFVNGYGAQNYDFPVNGIISSKFLGSDVLNAALKDYHSGIRYPEGKQYGFGAWNLASDLYNTGTIFSITGFTGSAHITISPNEENTMLNIDIFNLTTLTSGTYGKEAFSEENYPKSYVRDPSTVSPTIYGNISQTFHLQIANDGN
ncbi:MAG: hypothetical protein IPM36_21520 [Lewinellaceae bacterium]|nr:hypothetical protein [Lewinellaceae bacterium]